MMDSLDSVVMALTEAVGEEEEEVVPEKVLGRMGLASGGSRRNR